MKRNFSILDVETLEIHYWLNDGSHTMNAEIFNKCELELLGIFKELSSKLKVPIDIEVEALGQGGIKAWLKVHGDAKNQIIIAFLINLTTSVVFTPLTTTLEYVTNNLLNEFFEDPEIKELEKEKEKEELKYDIAKIRAKTQRLCKTIDETKIKKKRSNYFATAQECKKLEKISMTVTDSEKKFKINTKEVKATEFSKYIMTSDELDPDEDEKAFIEIVSPVLKKGKYQWVGVYQGNIIQFRMKSDEFKALVQTGSVRFQNGSSIICHLLTNKKITNQGEVMITGYDVLEVDEYYLNDHPIETSEGKRKRQKKEADLQQLDLFGNE